MSAYHATHLSPYDDACPDCAGIGDDTYADPSGRTAGIAIGEFDVWVVAARPVSAGDDRERLAKVIHDVLDAHDHKGPEPFCEYIAVALTARGVSLSTGDDRPLDVERLAALLHGWTCGTLRTDEWDVCLRDHRQEAKWLLAAGVSLSTGDDRLRWAAQAVDEGWHVVAGDEGRDQVRLRYASDLPARLNTLRAALTSPATTEDPTP